MVTEMPKPIFGESARIGNYADLTQEEQDLVVTAIRSFYENNSAGFDKDSTS
jgi:hypothetical protein